MALQISELSESLVTYLAVIEKAFDYRQQQQPQKKAFNSPNKGTFTGMSLCMLPDAALARKVFSAQFTLVLGLCKMLGLMGHHFFVGIEALH